MTNSGLRNSISRRKDECGGLTLSQRVEGSDGGGVCGDADLFLRHGALYIHRQSAVYVRVQVIHHSRGERHVH